LLCVAAASSPWSHIPHAQFGKLLLLVCFTQAETQTSTDPCRGPKLHWLPRVLEPSLGLVIIPLAALACQRASPSPPPWSYEKSAAEKRIDIKWVNWQAEKDQRPLDKHRNRE